MPLYVTKVLRLFLELRCEMAIRLQSISRDVTPTQRKGNKNEYENMGPFIREENIEFIARDIGESDSGPRLVERFKRIGVPEELIEYPNTKWRMAYDILDHYSNLGPTKESLEIISKITNIGVHPLNFRANATTTPDKVLKEYNKRLHFDKLSVVEKAVDFNSSGISETELYNLLRARQSVCGGTLLFETNHTHISTSNCGT